MTITLAQAAAEATEKDAYLLWGFILAGASVGLLFLELLVPSGGLLGLLCGLAAIGSVVAFFQHDPAFGVAALLLYMVLGPLLLLFVFKVWVHSPLAKTMVLGGETESQRDGDDAARDSEQARQKRLEQLRSLIGAVGVAETALRPVGFVKIAGQRLDAMAEAGVIEPDTPIVVVEVYDNQIKVRPQA